MTWLTDALSFLLDGSNWGGTYGLGRQTVEHLGLASLSLLLAVVVALPLGLWLGHTGRGGALAINVANVGRAVPTFAILVIFVLVGPPLGDSTTSFLLALTLFSIPPLLTNTYTGMREVDRAAVDAARGLGMSPLQQVLRVELPLATPLLMVGVRIAAVQVVATATVVGLVSTTALGSGIRAGVATRDQPQVVAGAVLVALLALLVEVLLGLLTRRLARRPSSRRAVAEGAAPQAAATPAG